MHDNIFVAILAKKQSKKALENVISSRLQAKLGFHIINIYVISRQLQ